MSINQRLKLRRLLRNRPAVPDSDLVQEAMHYVSEFLVDRLENLILRQPLNEVLISVPKLFELLRLPHQLVCKELSLLRAERLRYIVFQEGRFRSSSRLSRITDKPTHIDFIRSESIEMILDFLIEESACKWAWE